MIAPPARLAPGIAFVFAVFATLTGLASVLGTANLGTAATFGQLGLVAATIWIMLRA